MRNGLRQATTRCCHSTNPLVASRAVTRPMGVGGTTVVRHDRRDDGRPSPTSRHEGSGVSAVQTSPVTV